MVLDEIRRKQPPTTARIPPDKFKVLRISWRGMEVMGLSPALVLRKAGLPATLHLSQESLVTTAQYFALMRAAEELCAEPGAGLIAVLRNDPALLPPSNLAPHYARDYRDGLVRTARYKSLFGPKRLTILEDSGDWALSIDWFYATEGEPPMLTDITFAALMELGRRGTGVRIVPRRVELARPDDRSGVREDYFGCPILYDAPRSVLVIKGEDLDRPFRGHNPELLEMLSPALARALAELTAQSAISDQVKAVLKRLLPSGRPELRDVARELGMGERTLQRRIAEEGRTLRQLLSEARVELGRQLLLEPNVDLVEVAYLLGFEDSNSFYRAFRSWEGTTPARWRQQAWDAELSSKSGPSSGELKQV